MISCNVIMSVIINAKVVLMRYNFLYYVSSFSW